MQMNDSEWFTNGVLWNIPHMILSNMMIFHFNRTLRSVFIAVVVDRSPMAVIYHQRNGLYIHGSCPYTRAWFINQSLANFFTNATCIYHDENYKTNSSVLSAQSILLFFSFFFAWWCLFYLYYKWMKVHRSDCENKEIVFAMIQRVSSIATSNQSVIQHFFISNKRKNQCMLQFWFVMET